MTEGFVSRFPCIRAMLMLLILSVGMVQGQDLPSYFEKNCADCHGSQAHGNGSNWTSFVPHPANLTLVRDTQSMAYSIVSNGIAGTAMPASRLARNDFDKIWKSVRALPMSTNFQWSNPWTSEAGQISGDLGQKLYVTVCQDCHGSSGEGDGPWAREDNRIWPKPADFRARNSDPGRLYYIVMNGREGTMMAPQKNWLHEVGSWAAAQYVHGLYSESSTSTLPHPTRSPSTVTNPFSLPAPQAVNNGKQTSDLYCVPCHNAGAVGSFLAPNLVDRVWLYGRGTDPEVFTVIEKGIPGKLMPGFKSLAEERRWEVITYLRHNGGWPDPILTATHH